MSMTDHTPLDQIVAGIGETARLELLRSGHLLPRLEALLGDATVALQPVLVGRAETGDPTHGAMLHALARFAFDVRGRGALRAAVWACVVTTIGHRHVLTPGAPAPTHYTDQEIEILLAVGRRYGIDRQAYHPVEAAAAAWRVVRWAGGPLDGQVREVVRTAAMMEPEAANEAFAPIDVFAGALQAARTTLN